MSALSELEVTPGARPHPHRRHDARRRQPGLVLVKRFAAAGSPEAVSRVSTGGPAQVAHPEAARQAVAVRRMPARAQLRLTRRGRVVVTSVLAIAAVATALLVVVTASAGARATDHPGAGGGYTGMREVVVRPGQTLWSIAAAAEPSADTRVVVEQIMAVNSLTGTQIQAGQLLWVPR